MNYTHKADADQTFESASLHDSRISAVETI